MSKKKRPNYVRGWPDGLAYSKELQTSQRHNKLIAFVQDSPCNRKELMDLTGTCYSSLCADVANLKEAGVFREDMDGIISLAPVKGVKSCAVQ